MVVPLPIRTNWTSQEPSYVGYLVFPTIYSGGAFSGATPVMPQVVIPLRIDSLDEPIRQPKSTEISTIPTIDYVNQADGSIDVMIYGATDPLQTNISGTFQTPTTTVTDQLHPSPVNYGSHQLIGSTYQQVRPTATPVYDYANPPVVIPFDGVSRHPDFPLVMPDLTGYSYGDLVWLYLEGNFGRRSLYSYQRTDPLTYIDPFGRVYDNPVIAQYTCTHVPGALSEEQITLQMWLET